MNCSSCWRWRPSAIRRCSGRFRLRAALLALPLGAACSTGEYYAQAARGQWELLDKRRDIQEVLSDPQTDQQLRDRLATVLAIRDFAVADLGLPDNGSYRSFVALERPYAVWNVVAAEAFNTEPATWCYPIVGCLSYRGYFGRSRALAYAQGLRAQGYDVYVGGVVAYSTLGYFDDPLLSTMLRWDDTRLAALIFHELAHQRLFVAGDTEFNESFASTVEAEGVRRWLLATGRGSELAVYRRDLEELEQVMTLIESTRLQLSSVYAGDFDQTRKLELKERIFQGSSEAYRRLSADWPAPERYRGWFDGEANNARLAAIATYGRHVPAFQALLVSVDGDLAAFYRAAEELGRLDPEVRTARLEGMVAGGLSGNG